MEGRARIETEGGTSPRRGQLAVCVFLASVGSLLTGCLLDLGSLSNGGSSPSGSSSGSGGSGGSGGEGGQASCPLLDCTCASEPRVLAAGPMAADSPRGIVATSDGVYWVNQQSNEVRRLSGGGGPSELLTATLAPVAIAVTDGTVVWTAADGVHACLASSCSSSQHLVFASTVTGSLRDVAFDGQLIAWTDQGTGNQDGKTRVCPLGGACTPNDLDTQLSAPQGLAFHESSVFWVDQGNGNQNGNVHSELKVGGNYAQLAASLDLPTGIAVDDTYVYWTSWVPSGHVYRCAYASSPCDTPEDVAPAAGALARPYDIQVAEGRIYWSNTDDGSIMSCPQPGCGTDQPAVHVTGRQGLHRLAVGASCLFWTEDSGGGAVLKLAR